MDLYEARNWLSKGKTIYEMPLRVTFYARVSTEKDAQLHSLAAQVQYYSEYIGRCGAWTYIEGYVDEGLSGTSVGKRESFLKMIEDAKHGAFDFIITKEISRFSRNTLDSIHYTQELLKHGVGILFQSDNINTLMPDAELRLTIMSSIAQDEVRKTSERVRFGFRRAIEHGVVLGNSRIWGYRKEQGVLVTEEREAEMVRLIFELYANQRLGIRAVADYLTEHGYRNRNGNGFSFSTVRGILANPKYKGYYCGGKSSKYDYKLNCRKQLPPEQWVTYEAAEKVPEIVPPELWEKANRLLQSRAEQRKGKQGSGQTKYAYSGKLICGQHHVPYYRSVYRYPSGEREVWHCREYSRKGRAGCTMPVLYTGQLDRVICQILKMLPIRKADMIHSMLRFYAAAQQEKGLEMRLRKGRQMIETIRKRKDTLLDLMIAEEISEEEFRARNEQFNAQLNAQTCANERLEKELCQGKENTYDTALLEQALEQELSFENGFSYGVIDALIDQMTVRQEEGKTLVAVHSPIAAIEQEYIVKSS